MLSHTKAVFFLIALAGVFYFLPRREECPFISFDLAMSKINPAFPEWCGEQQKRKVRAEWKLSRKLYEKVLSAPPSAMPRIPKLIHQIWLGGALPAKYLPLQKSWKEHHPDWVYRLWTDADLQDFPFMNRKRFEEARNIGEKADIFRYEILNRFGGVYADTDFECLRPFDILHAYCDFYAGIEAPFPDQRDVMMGNALIGSVPGHPILQCCLRRIAERSPGNNPGEVMEVSGPGCLKRAYFKCCQQGRFRNVAFPFTFFYPIPAKAGDHQLGKIIKEQWLQPESFGV